jgi:Zn finger protein HypA/HybF involved in hydrogenase expression
MKCWSCGKPFEPTLTKVGPDLLADCPMCSTTHIYLGKESELKSLVVGWAVNFDGEIIYFPKK